MVMVSSVYMTGLLIMVWTGRSVLFPILIDAEQYSPVLRPLVRASFLNRSDYIE